MTAPTPAPAASFSAKTLPSCPSNISTENHQSPEIEAILPSVVAGRSLARWSVSGRCWLEVAVDTPAQGVDQRNYEQATIGGKQVFSGTLDMLDQTDHQRGRPHLNQTDEYMIVVVTDDDAWASDAIGQLP